MDAVTADRIRSTVREAYGAVARREAAEGCCSGPSCCGPVGTEGTRLGYTEGDLAALPEGANLGLGCGNPHAIAQLAAGERVLDLGSGGGIDAFLASQKVGATGKVIGVDMTPDMIALARRNAVSVRANNVEFRLGDIEHLPVEDDSVDVIMSNCVINLAPDKPAVFREAYRVLAPGGRLAISDMVATGDLPKAIAEDPTAYTGCIAGATPVDELKRMIAAAGFSDVRVTIQSKTRDLVEEWSPGTGASQLVASALIEASKPTAAASCCSTEGQSSCCAPEAKASCCSPADHPGSCGCR